MTIRTTSWEKDENDIRLVRTAVFVNEQGIEETLDFDGLDPQCVHILAYSDQQKPIGTARMQQDGHIGRIAVLKEWRNKGIGTRMVNELIKLALKMDIPKVYLHSQNHAVAFYEKLGFKKEGDLFFEADIPHYKMTKVIKNCMQRNNT